MPRKKEDRMARKRAALGHASSALTDAADEAATIEGLLVLLHLAGMTLDQDTAGSVSTGAMVARQHMACLRDNLDSARRELGQLRSAYRHEEHGT